MANVNYPNSRIYSGHYFPVLIDFNFIVDATNGNGLGIRSLKGAYVKNVFMNTTASITGNTHTNFVIDGIAQGTGSLVVGMQLSGTGIAAGTTIASITSGSAITTSLATTATNTSVTITTVAPGSPNPDAGLILVQLKSNFNRLLFSNIGDASPVSGSNLAVDGSSLSVGQAYIITVLGTTTAADWLVLGVPLGVTPAVGVSFIALVTGTGSGSGQVQLAKATGSGITKYDLIGDPNLSAAPYDTPFTSVIGSWVLFRALAATASGTTTFVATAPSINTTIGIQLWMSNSSLLLGGQ